MDPERTYSLDPYHVLKMRYRKHEPALDSKLLLPSTRLFKHDCIDMICISMSDVHFTEF